MTTGRSFPHVRATSGMPRIRRRAAPTGRSWESVASETASTTSATDSHALFSPSLAVNVLDPLYVLNHFAFDSAGNRSLLGVASLVDRRLVPVDPGLLIHWESLIQFQIEFQHIDPRLAQDS